MISVTVGKDRSLSALGIIGVAGDNLSENILFKLPEEVAGVDARLYNLHILIEKVGFFKLAINADYTAIFEVPDSVTATKGDFTYALRMTRGEVKWGSKLSKFSVAPYVSLDALPDDEGDVHLSFLNPYAEAGAESLKSALHWHSTSSDGAQSYKDVQDAYWAAGFDVAVKTDHNNSEGGTAQVGGLFIRGLEQSTTEEPHVGVFPLSSDTQSWRSQPQAGGQQHGSIADVVAYYKNLECVTIANHPTEQGYVYTVEQVAANGFDAVEIYNGKYDKNFEPFWDEVLTAGHKVWGIATDDCHDVTGTKFNVAWTNILATNATSADVVTAIKAGHIIACKGHDLEIISVEGESLSVGSSIASTFQIIGNGGVVVDEKSGTSATFDIDMSGLAYVRVKSISNADSGKYACSQPFFVN